MAINYSSQEVKVTARSAATPENASRVTPEVEQIAKRFSSILDTVESKSTLSLQEMNAIRIAKETVAGYTYEVPELKAAALIKYGTTKDIKVAEMSDNEIVRIGLMLLYSRAFNEADNAGEWLLENQKRGRNQNLDMTPQMQIRRSMRYPIGKFIEVKSGRQQSILVGDVLYMAIPAIERVLEVPNAKEHEQAVDRIVSSQMHGLKLVEKLSTRGIPYSKPEAMTYVQKTVGTYARLLADVVFEDHKKKNDFAQFLLEKKNNDDRLDILKDVFSQPNPYLAEAFRKGHASILSFIAKEAYLAYRIWQKASKILNPTMAITSKDKFLEGVGKMYYKYFPEVATIKQPKLRPVY